MGAAAFLVERWRSLRSERTRAVVAAEARACAAATAGNLLTGLAYIACLAWVAWGIFHHGRLEIGSYVAVTVAAAGFAERLGGMIIVVRGFDEHALYLADLMSFIRGEPPAPVGPPAPDRCDCPGEGPPAVQVRDLAFRYPAGTGLALERVILDITPGECVALVGANGAGKTTLAKCLLGLYEPDQGTVLVGGRPAARPGNRRAAVFQDYARYQLTLREAVGFGDLAQMSDDRAIGEVLKRAGLGDLVDQLPGGLNAYLGPEFGGMDLSGGQWQRLALARAFLREADLLVLDEPTAALDALAELALFERFAELAQGRTAIMISHRLGAARLADRILVLDQGRVVEQGSHAELVSRGGPYARMFASQAVWYRRATRTGNPDADG